MHLCPAGHEPRRISETLRGTLPKQDLLPVHTVRTCSLIVVLLAASGVLATRASAQDEIPPYSFSSWTFHLGDDARWAAPAWDDRHWQDFNAWYYSPAADTTALFWSRIKVEIHETKGPGDKKGLDLSILGAYDVYWDGHLIGQSGQVGHGLATEVPGPIDNAFLLPDSLYTPGTHTLALRISTFGNQRRIRYYVHRIGIGDYPTLTTYRMSASLLPLFFLGGFFIIGIYYLLLWLVTDRSASNLLFSLLCFSVSVLLIAESWRGILGYPADRHIVRMVVVAGATFVIGVLLPLFFMVQFSFPKKRYWLGLLLASLSLAALLPRAYNPKSLFMFALIP